jgi:AAA domain
MPSTREKVEIAEAKADTLRQEIFDFLEKPEGVFIVSAAPGSGKSFLLLKLVRQLVANGKRVAVAAQTNFQANSLISSWYKNGFDQGLNMTRLASVSLKTPAGVPETAWIHSASSIPTGNAAVVSTSAKWADVSSKSNDGFSFDVLVVDEAFQMTWTTYLMISTLASRIVFIGDEGQLDPVVMVDSAMWDTAMMPPHWPAPKTVRNIKDRLGEKFGEGRLNSSWRIPFESLDAVQPFYDALNVKLEPVAQLGERSLSLAQSHLFENDLDRAIEAGSSGHPVLIKVPNQEGAYPKGADAVIAKVVAKLLEKILENCTDIVTTSFDADKEFRKENHEVSLSKIMILSTKKEMLAALETHLQPVLRKVRDNQPELYESTLLNGGLFVDTPERAQGLERPIVIIVHPLSGVSKPNEEFDLSTGRLSVMVSRHQNALFIVSRDGVGETLAANLPSASQAPGVLDESGRGHKQHIRFWQSFRDEQVFALSDDFVSEISQA